MGKNIYPKFPSKTWIQNVFTKYVPQLTKVGGPILWKIVLQNKRNIKSMYVQFW
jgi:hypothetical protein